MEASHSLNASQLAADDEQFYALLRVRSEAKRVELSAAQSEIVALQARIARLQAEIDGMTSLLELHQPPTVSPASPAAMPASVAADDGDVSERPRYRVAGVTGVEATQAVPGDVTFAGRQGERRRHRGLPRRPAYRGMTHREAVILILSNADEKSADDLTEAIFEPGSEQAFRAAKMSLVGTLAQAYRDGELERPRPNVYRLRRAEQPDERPPEQAHHPEDQQVYQPDMERLLDATRPTDDQEARGDAPE